MTYDRERLQAELDQMQNIMDRSLGEVHEALRKVEKVSGAIGMLRALIAQPDAPTEDTPQAE